MKNEIYDNTHKTLAIQRRINFNCNYIYVNYIN